MNVFKAILLGILLSGMLFPQSTDDKIASAQTLIESKEFEQAEQLLTEAISHDPSYAPVLFKLAQVYLYMGNMDQAEANFRLAIDFDPENKEYRDEFDRVNEINSVMSEGQRSLNSNELDEAYLTFQKVLDQFPFFANAAYNMGGIKIRQKEYDTAIEDFTKALEINPGFQNAQSAIATVVKNTFNDGNTLYRRGDLEGALEAYNKVIEYDATFYQACYQIGVISTRMGDVDQAIDYYQKALDVSPTFYKGWYALGLAQKKISDSEGAMQSLQKALDINPTYARAYSVMGEILLNKQEFEKAIEKFQMAISVDPSYTKAYENLGITFVKIENWNDAITQLELAVQFNAKSLNGWYHLAMVYNKTQDCENALRCARRAIDIKQNYSPALIEQGVAYWCNGKGDKTRALNSIEKARNDSRWRRVAEYEIDRIKNPEKYEE